MQAYYKRACRHILQACNILYCVHAWYMHAHTVCMHLACMHIMLACMLDTCMHILCACTCMHAYNACMQGACMVHACIYCTHARTMHGACMQYVHHALCMHAPCMFLAWICNPCMLLVGPCMHDARNFP